MGLLKGLQRKNSKFTLEIGFKKPLRPLDLLVYLRGLLFKPQKLEKKHHAQHARRGKGTAEHATSHLRPLEKEIMRLEKKQREAS